MRLLLLSASREAGRSSPPSPGIASSTPSKQLVTERSSDAWDEDDAAAPAAAAAAAAAAASPHPADIPPRSVSNGRGDEQADEDIDEDYDCAAAFVLVVRGIDNGYYVLFCVARSPIKVNPRPERPSRTENGAGEKDFFDLFSMWGR
jgi:hypothetical protein